MKFLCFPLLVALASSSSASPWEPVWSDEFSVDGAPDPSKWDYEIGFVRNEELQYYTSRRENSRVEKGHLVIEARAETFPNPKFVPASKSWKNARRQAEVTSASLITMGKASWTYGRIEIRAEMPTGVGLWPALWTLGTNHEVVSWPACGEIDILEWLGREPAHLYANAHFRKADGTKSSHMGKKVLGAPISGFHEYALEWSPEELRYFFDGQPYHRVPLALADHPDGNPFRLPHYLIVNLAVGGSWGGKLDPSALPAQFRIDYVRVFKKRGS